jgi:hypothetical protein
MKYKEENENVQTRVCARHVGRTNTHQQPPLPAAETDDLWRSREFRCWYGEGRVEEDEGERPPSETGVLERGTIAGDVSTEEWKSDGEEFPVLLCESSSWGIGD